MEQIMIKTMKYIKTFNESLSQEEIDSILDRIHQDGINSLSEREKKELENINNPNYDFKEDLINYIKSKVNGKFITMQDLQAESSPVYLYINNEYHLVERLMHDKVEIVAYDEFTGEDKKEYYKKYEKLFISTLFEIKELLENKNESILENLNSDEVSELISKIKENKLHIEGKEWLLNIIILDLLECIWGKENDMNVYTESRFDSIKNNITKYLKSHDGNA